MAPHNATTLDFGANGGEIEESELPRSSTDTMWSLHDGQTDLNSRLRRWMALSRMEPATSIGRRQTRRYLRSLPISCALSKCISMDARCTRRWRLGDARRHSWPDRSASSPAGPAGFRAVLASGRQGRLFQRAGYRLYTDDASRAGIRSAGGSRPEASIASRRFRGWSRPCRPCNPGYAWRRQVGPAQQRLGKARSPGRAPFY